MRAKFTCKDCGDRYPGCHSKSEKYIAEKAEYDERKEIEYQKRKVQNDINSMRTVSICKSTGKNSWYSIYRNYRRG